MILEMIKCHNMADVFYAAKTLRNYKPNMVETLVSTSHRWLLVPAHPSGREERCRGSSPPRTLPNQTLVTGTSCRACLGGHAAGWGGRGGEAALESSLVLAFILPCQRALGDGTGLVGNPSQEEQGRFALIHGM